MKVPLQIIFRPGAEVRFSEEQGEKGPQAGTVEMAGQGRREIS
jgi:hypothetical protein